MNLIKMPKAKIVKHDPRELIGKKFSAFLDRKNDPEYGWQNRIESFAPPKEEEKKGK